jgi:hypothetical protein
MSEDNKQRCSRDSTDGRYWFRRLESLLRMDICLGCADALERTTLFPFKEETVNGTINEGADILLAEVEQVQLPGFRGILAL